MPPKTPRRWSHEELLLGHTISTTSNKRNKEKDVTISKSINNQIP
jgi:hypothetical protein